MQPRTRHIRLLWIIALLGIIISGTFGFPHPGKVLADSGCYPPVYQQVAGIKARLTAPGVAFDCYWTTHTRLLTATQGSESAELKIIQDMPSPITLVDFTATGKSERYFHFAALLQAVVALAWIIWSIGRVIQKRRSKL